MYAGQSANLSATASPASFELDDKLLLGIKLDLNCQISGRIKGVPHATLSQVRRLSTIPSDRETLRTTSGGNLQIVHSSRMLKIATLAAPAHDAPCWIPNRGHGAI